MSRIVAVIPARAGSKRLKEKNIQPVLNKPLMAWVIEAAGDAIGIDNVYVSTESSKVAAVAYKYGAHVIARPDHLALDSTLTEPVIQHAVREIEDLTGSVDKVLWLNASIPEITSEDIQEAIGKLEAHNLWEVCTRDADGICNSAVRVLTRKALSHNGLSVYLGTIEKDYLDIHYEEDLRTVEQRMMRRGVS